MDCKPVCAGSMWACLTPIDAQASRFADFAGRCDELGGELSRCDDNDNDATLRAATFF